MPRDDDSDDVLEDVARMHPAVDRLRHLLAAAALLDMKASADGYWTHQAGGPEGRAPSTPPEGGR
jgi:hypothetical protein